jgi:hypothetical protein
MISIEKTSFTYTYLDYVSLHLQSTWSSYNFFIVENGVELHRQVQSQGQSRDLSFLCTVKIGIKSY